MRNVHCLFGVSIVLTDIANSTKQALESIESVCPEAVILDLELHMGSGNGLEFLKILREEKTPLYPYVLITTYNTSKTTIETSRKLGADFVMLKTQ